MNRRKKEKHDLSIKKDSRTPPYQPLGEYDGVQLVWHHVVPYNKLAAFWNDLIKDPARIAEVKRMADRMATRLPDYRTTLTARDREHLVALLSNLPTYEHDAKELIPGEGGSWDNFTLIYGTPPGNAFVGPEATHRSDDPKENFESGCELIITKDRFNRLKALDTNIDTYLRSHSKNDAITVLRGLETDTIDKYEIPQFKANQWDRVGGKFSIKKKKDDGRQLPGPERKKIRVRGNIDLEIEF
ncbi:hypothetical protein [Streptomyces blastmyceticus]|uniref:Uncharacterized protein n=1 Tax=Streptomyces blastmyceticus TaxID=68180 RepID=A0ABN0W831_9ACTN